MQAGGSDSTFPEGQLTPRQSEVAELARQGQPAKVIARRLGISKRTVEAHLSRARERTGTVNTVALVSYLILSNTAVEPGGSCSETEDIYEQSPRTGSVHSSRPGRRPGRPTVMTEATIAAAREMLPSHSISEIARKLGVGRTTLHAHMKEIRGEGDFLN